jgi:ERCC4-type nuclease
MTTSVSAPIALDDRRGSAELLGYFPPGVARLARLEFGDAAFMGKGAGGAPVMVGVERKTLRDLVGSLESGRLAGHQLPGLQASYNTVYLVIEGIYRESRGNLEERVGEKWKAIGITEKGFNGYLNTLSVLGGVIVRQTTYPSRTAGLIVHLYRWWERGLEEHKSHLGFYEVPAASALLLKPSLIRLIAKELPGIGWERSIAVERHFGSILSMMVAGEDEWRQIPGIGKVLSQQIVKAVRRNGRA